MTGIGIFIASLLLSIFTITTRINSRKINTLEKQVCEAETLQDLFLSNISHELRTPMNSIMGFSNLIDSSIGVDELKRYLLHINTSSNNLLSSVSNLMEASMLYSNQIICEKKIFSLCDINDDIRKNITDSIGRYCHKNLTILNKIDLNYSITSDKNCLIGILKHIIDNAIKFSDNNGSVSIKAEFSGKYIIINVSNNGKELDIERMHFFKKHFSKANKLSPGMGLGLAIAYKLADISDTMISYTYNKNGETNARIKVKRSA